MKDINLLLASKSDRASFDIRRGMKNAGTVVAVIVFAVALVTGALMYVNYRSAAEQTRLRARIEELSTVEVIKASIADKQQQLDTISKVLDAAGDASYVGTPVIAGINRALDKNIFLTSLSISENGEMNLTGKAAARSEIAYFSQRLTNTEGLSDVSIKSILATTAEGSTVETYDFNITVMVKGQAADEEG